MSEMREKKFYRMTGLGGGLGYGDCGGTESIERITEPEKKNPQVCPCFFTYLHNFVFFCFLSLYFIYCIQVTC